LVYQPQGCMGIGHGESDVGRAKRISTEEALEWALAQTIRSPDTFTATSTPRSRRPSTPALCKTSRLLGMQFRPDPLQTAEPDSTDSFPSKESNMTTDCSDGMVAAKLTRSCSRQQASRTPSQRRRRSSLVETELHTLKPDVSTLAEHALPAYRNHMPQKRLNNQFSPVVHELESREVLSCTHDAKHEDVGRADACTQTETVSLPTTLNLFSLCREINETPSDSSLQFPRKFFRSQTLVLARPAAGADCTLGTSVTKRSKTLVEVHIKDVGLPTKLSEATPLSSPRTMKNHRSRLAGRASVRRPSAVTVP